MTVKVKCPKCGHEFEENTLSNKLDKLEKRIAFLEKDCISISDLARRWKKYDEQKQ